MGWQKQPQSISQRWNHWEWRNEIPIIRKPPRDDLDGGFFGYRKDVWSFLFNVRVATKGIAPLLNN